MSPLPHRKHSEFPGWEFSTSISQWPRLGVTPLPKDSSLLQPLSQRRPRPESILLRSVWQAQSSPCSFYSAAVYEHAGAEGKTAETQKHAFSKCLCYMYFQFSTKILPSNTVTKIVQTLLVYSIKFVFVLRVKINVHAV